MLVERADAARAGAVAAALRQASAAPAQVADAMTATFDKEEP